MNYHIIENKKILTDFLKEIFPILSTESILVLSSFRSKKLPAEIKTLLSAREREIYLTKTLRTPTINKIYELEVPYEACTFEDVTLPQSALVCYINPNPSNEIDVAIQHMNSTLSIVNSYIHSENKQFAENQLAHHSSDFKSERMSQVRRNWIDFDVDIDFSPAYDEDEIFSELKKIVLNSPILEEETRGMVIFTSGGFHILIKKDCLKGNPNILAEDFKAAISNLNETVKEINYKKDVLVPLPGTIQYGEHLVTFKKF